jgi:hypothetical protein
MMGVDPLMWRRPVGVAAVFRPKALRTKTSSHATGEIQDVRVALIPNDEDLILLIPVRRAAAPIRCAPSEGSEEP